MDSVESFQVDWLLGTKMHGFFRLNSDFTSFTLSIILIKLGTYGRELTRDPKPPKSFNGEGLTAFSLSCTAVNVAGINITPIE